MKEINWNKVGRVLAAVAIVLWMAIQLTKCKAQSTEIDSTISFLFNDTTEMYEAKWKTEYVGNETRFYEMEQGWKLYGKWVYENNSLQFFSADSAGNMELNHRKEFQTGKDISYSIDSSGEEKIICETIYYYSPVTALNIGILDLNVYSHNGMIYVSSSKHVQTVDVYSIDGKLMDRVNVNSTKAVILATRGAFIVKVNFESHSESRKLIIE